MMGCVHTTVSFNSVADADRAHDGRRYASVQTHKLYIKDGVFGSAPAAPSTLGAGVAHPPTAAALARLDAAKPLMNIVCVFPHHSDRPGQPSSRHTNVTNDARTTNPPTPLHPYPLHPRPADEFRSKVACENEIVQLTCNPYSRIAIYSASYGRTEYESIQCAQPQGVREESK